MHSPKIDDLTLFNMVASLGVAMLVAVVGLALTINREYRHTFVSLETGRAYCEKTFCDFEGDDARRARIFLFNERQWQAIRDRVRQWVLSVYAAWQALMPAWLTEDLQARIPDDFMPAQALQDRNTQVADGKRLSVQNMGMLRRVSHRAVVDTEDPFDSDGRLRIPAFKGCKLKHQPASLDVRRGTASGEHGSEHLST